MNELLIVGRGGEGVVLASQVLADALARGGAYVQAFPEFTAERRGAPISAFVRWDDRPIRRRYKIHDCDVLLCTSPAPPAGHVLRRVRSGGLVVLNHEQRVPLAGPFALARVPASTIARRHRIVSADGRPIGNAALLGAFVRLRPDGSLELLEQAIEARTGRLAAANVAAAREGFERCVRQRPRPEDAVVPAGPAPEEGAPTGRPRFAVSTTGSQGRLTGAWSFDRPLLLEACTACALCSAFCPEGALRRRDGTMEIDYDHCKGCGICVSVCPVRGAILMEEVAA